MMKGNGTISSSIGDRLGWESRLAAFTPPALEGPDVSCYLPVQDMISRLSSTISHLSSCAGLFRRA